MEITTTPICRVGWQGETLHYVVKAEGATELVIGEHDMEGVDARITGARQVEGGVEADLAVEIIDSELY